MASRLKALRDYGVTTICFQESRFIDRRRGANDFASRSFHPRHQFFFREAVVEAHDRRLELLDDRARLCVERPARGADDWRSWVNAELEIIRLESFPPRILTRIVWHRHLVREKIEVKRLVFGRGTESRDLRANLLSTQHARRQGPKTARFRDRDRELGVRGSGHWSLQDGDVDGQKIQKRSVRPHRLLRCCAGSDVSAFDPPYEFAPD